MSGVVLVLTLPLLVFVGMLLFYVSELILEGILPH